MENVKKCLMLALKQNFLDKFSTYFILSLICVRYVSKDLKTLKKQGVTDLYFEISPDLTKNECKSGQGRPSFIPCYLLLSTSLTIGSYGTFFEHKISYPLLNNLTLFGRFENPE